MDGNPLSRITGLDWFRFGQQDTVSKIFVSYRREDSRGDAGRLTDKLKAHFGDKQIFRDIEAIDPGLDFVETISNAVGSCAVLLAIIGPNWLKSADSTGQRRLDDPHDFVRLELSAALNRNIRVITVLVGGAAMPKAEELPSTLESFARRQAHELSDSRWDFDVQHLVETLEKIGIRPLAKPGSNQGFWTKTRFGFAIGGAVLFLTGVIFTKINSPTVVPAYNPPTAPISVTPTPMPSPHASLSYGGFEAIGRYPTIVQVYEPT